MHDTSQAVSERKQTNYVETESDWTEYTLYP